MDEPWMVAEGSDSDGTFVVKLNGRFIQPESRLGLPIRVSLVVSGAFVVNELLNKPDTRGSIEDAFYEYARLKGGAMVATIARATSYAYTLQLPADTADSTIPVPEKLKSYITVEICADVNWDEYCSFLYARRQPIGLIERARRVLGRLARKS